MCGVCVVLDEWFWLECNALCFLGNNACLGKFFWPSISIFLFLYIVNFVFVIIFCCIGTGRGIQVSFPVGCV